MTVQELKDKLTDIWDADPELSSTIAIEHAISAICILELIANRGGDSSDGYTGRWCQQQAKEWINSLGAK